VNIPLKNLGSWMFYGGCVAGVCADLLLSYQRNSVWAIRDGNGGGEGGSWGFCRKEGRMGRSIVGRDLSGPTSKVTLMKTVDKLVWANSQMLGCQGIFTVGLLQPLGFDVAVRGPKTG